MVLAVSIGLNLILAIAHRWSPPGEAGSVLAGKPVVEMRGPEAVAGPVERALGGQID